MIPYSIIGTNVSVIFGGVKEICDSEFSKEDFLATMFGGLIAITEQQHDEYMKVIKEKMETEMRPQREEVNDAQE